MTYSFTVTVFYYGHWTFLFDRNSEHWKFKKVNYFFNWKEDLFPLCYAIPYLDVVCWPIFSSWKYLQIYTTHSVYPKFHGNISAARFIFDCFHNFLSLKPLSLYCTCCVKEISYGYILDRKWRTPIHPENPTAYKNLHID